MQKEWQMLICINNSIFHKEKSELLWKREMNYLALNICGFYIHWFNQQWVKNIQEKKSYVVADIYYVIRSKIVASVLNMYRLFFLSLFPKQYNVVFIQHVHCVKYYK